MFFLNFLYSQSNFSMHSSIRPIQRKSWIISYPASRPDISILIRETRIDLDIDECYSSCEDGKRYVLFHFDRKLRTCVVEQALSECGAAEYELYGLETAMDSLSQRWLSILTRHYATDDARLSAWVKPGRMRSLMSSVRGGGGQQHATVSRAEGVAVSTIARSKRPRGGDDNGADSGRPSLEQQLLAEKDRQLVEKDTRYELALADLQAQHQRSLADKDAHYACVLASRDEEMRKVLVRHGDADQRVGEVEAKLTSVLSGLRAAGGDASEREIVLACDLNAEKRKVAYLASQLKVTCDNFEREVEAGKSVKIHYTTRVRELELDMQSLRTEAQRWECDREQRTSALRVCAEKLSAASADIEQLRAACDSKDRLVAELRSCAYEIIEAEMTATCDGRLAQAHALLESGKKECKHKEEKYKKRNAALHRELHVAQAQLRGFVAGMQ